MNQQWFKDWGYICYVKITDNGLRNTKGVLIHPNGYVIISHFDHTGWNKPYILCNKDEFEIYEWLIASTLESKSKTLQASDCEIIFLLRNHYLKRDTKRINNHPSK
jgi:hypothetical protein